MKHIYLSLFILFLTNGLFAQQEGNKLTFQGSLYQSEDPFNGTVSLSFSVVINATETWSETITNVAVSNGLYSVILGETNPLPEDLFWETKERTMSVSVDGTSLGDVMLYAPFSTHKPYELPDSVLSDLGGAVALPLDLAGPNGSRSVMLSSEGESGEDGMFRLANGEGRSKITMYANGYYQDEADNTVYSNAGGAWFGGNNGRTNIRLGATGEGYNHGMIELGDAEGNTMADLSVMGTDTTAYGLLSINSAAGNTATFGPTYTRFIGIDDYISTLSRSGLSLRKSDEEYNYNWFRRGNTQVAEENYATEGKATGFNGGYFYMDYHINDAFYIPFSFGIASESDGGGSFFDFSSLQRAMDGKPSLFNISTASNASNQQAAQVYLYGENSVNFQMGGETWDNPDMAFFHMYGRSGTGDGWYQENVRMAVGTDGSVDFGSLSLFKTGINDNSKSETILLNGSNGDVTIAGSLSQSSDKRLKTKINTLDNALDNTLKLRGVSYFWKKDDKEENKQIGVIAQELEEVYPEFVHTDENGMKSVNYAQMTAVLIESIKELNEKIVNLEKENTSLKAAATETAALESRLDQIEKLLGLKIDEQSSASTK